jgi:Zn-dependent protease with chaperone function
MRINGLYGHVRSNDVRSLALFASFVAAFQLLAMMALLMPLAMFDPDHAPLYGWTGYLIRWVPIVTVIGAVLFATQMAWHVRTVRRRTDFRFVDDHDEPRLCRIVEPLAIAAGVAPYVGVIHSPALNAFACGIRQKDAVLVFTRGLIDGLDDDELAAVAAHEIIHIVNGDIRLIAATNVCLDTLKLLQPRPSTRRMQRISQACMFPFAAVALPMMAVLALIVMFLRRLAVDGSHLARLLIASAREFIADAEAVRLTQNPAALVSALRRIEGRSVIPGLAAGQDAMMIDGAHEGAFATHPTIAERVAAIISVTGSMALIAPAGRDTRPPGLSTGEGFGRRVPPALEAAFSRLARQDAGAALARVSSGEYNRLGLTPELTLGAVAAIGLFLWVHSADLGRPSALVKAFDPAPMRTYFAMAREGLRCELQGFGSVAGLAAAPQACDLNAMLVDYRGKGGIFGKLADALPEVGQSSSGVTTRADGTFSNRRLPDLQLAEVQRARCFQTGRYSVFDDGFRTVTEEPRHAEDVSLRRYLASSDAAARSVMEAIPAERDRRLIDYFKARKAYGEMIHRFFGDPGLQVAAPRYAGPEHQAAIALLRQRLTDPGFASALSPLERAEIDVLAAAPQDFVSCIARRTQEPKKA